MFLAQIQQVKALVPQRRLRSLMRRADGPGWVFLGRHLGWLAVTGGIVWQAAGTAWLVPAMTLHGIGIVHLFSAQHEFAHRTAFRTRVLNDVFGNLFGFIIMLPHVYFRWEHTEHHTYTQVSGRDPQLISQPKSLWQYLLYLSTIPYWLGFLRPFVRHVIGIIPPNERRFIPATETWKVVWEARAMFVAYAGLLIVSLWLRTEVLWFYWLGPRLLGEPFMRFIRMSEHVGRPVNEPDLLQNSRTCIVWAPLRWLAWNMPYHAEHHLSPGVPFHALPALHRELRAVPRPITAGYHGAHREILGRVLHADAVAVSPS